MRGLYPRPRLRSRGEEKRKAAGRPGDRKRKREGGGLTSSSAWLLLCSSPPAGRPCFAHRDSASASSPHIRPHLLCLALVGYFPFRLVCLSSPLLSLLPPLLSQIFEACTLQSAFPPLLFLCFLPSSSVSFPVSHALLQRGDWNCSSSLFLQLQLIAQWRVHLPLPAIMILETNLLLLSDERFQICYFATLLCCALALLVANLLWYYMLRLAILRYDLLLNFSSIYIKMIIWRLINVCMASPRRPPQTPRRCEGGRAPRLAAAPQKHWLNVN